MKKKRIIFMGVLIAILLSPLRPFFLKAFGQGDFEILYKLGFNAYYKNDTLTPARIKIKNNYGDFNGEVQLIFRKERKYGKDVKELGVKYTKDLTMAKGTTKEVLVGVKIFERCDTMTVRIIDDNRNKIWDEDIKIQQGSSRDSVGIGVLSDDAEALNYLNLIFFKDRRGDMRDPKTVRLDGKLLENPEYYTLFNTIVINNYNSEKLTEGEVFALETWVEKGGLLVVGTGPNYEKTLKGLGKLNFISVNGTKNITDYSSFKDSNGNIFKSDKSLSIIDGNKGDGDVIEAQGDTKLIFRKKVGDGNVIITSFDLGLSPFIDWNKKDTFLQDKLNSYINNINMDNDHSYYKRMYNNITQRVPTKRLPSLRVIAIILAIFLILVGPINYIILKKLDKRLWGWITIPAMVLIFTSIMYFWGNTNRFTKPLINSLTIANVDIENETIKLDTVSSIFAFNQGDVDLEIANNINYNIPEEFIDELLWNNADGEYDIEYILENKKHIILKNREKWDLESLETTETIKDKKFLDYSLNINSEKITGNIKNLYPLRLEDTSIIYGYNYQRLGDLNIDEEKEINIRLKKRKVSLSDFDFYQELTNDLYGYTEHYSPYNMKLDGDLLDNSVKRGVLLKYLQDSYNINPKMNKALLIGWSRLPISSSIKINDGYGERIDRNLIVIPLNISYKKGDKVIMPYGVIPPNINLMDGEINKDYDEVFLDGSALIQMEPIKDIDITKIKVHSNSDMLSDEIDIDIFNYKTNKWEDFGSTYVDVERIIDKDSMDRYYDKEMGVKLKIEAETRDRGVNIPQFYIEGVAK
ncbi:hypothetical protein [Dethiothermospora halolimnae]|uniref:hypothetical protein n=1 Tax=Dethiothermospora halolimnae TaxID=3114390 RepID=UPI003CCC3AEB